MSEVGLKEWDEGGLKEGKDGKGVGRKRFVSCVFLSFVLLFSF